MAASSERLGNIHEMFSTYWEMRMLQALDPNPEVRVAISSAELAVLRAFLKDNGVQADDVGSKELDALSSNLKAATAGIVTDSEMSGIMDDFNRHMSHLGLGTEQ